MELRNALMARFSVSLPATFVFDYPTVAALAKAMALLVQPSAGTMSSTQASFTAVYNASASHICNTWTTYAALGWCRLSSALSRLLRVSIPNACLMPAQVQPEEGESFTGSELLAVAARYPGRGAEGSDGFSSFWATACAGANLPSTVPLERWDIDSCHSPDLAAGKMCALLTRGC